MPEFTIVAGARPKLNDKTAERIVDVLIKNYPSN